MAPRVHILKINHHESDGNAKQWPNSSRYVRDDQYWLDQLGKSWAKARNLSFSNEVMYRLDRLPDGYAGFKYIRPHSAGRVDRYLYGHPHARNDAIKQYTPHFLNLMDSGSPAGCTCKRCKQQRSATLASSQEVEDDTMITPPPTSPPTTKDERQDNIISRLVSLQQNETVNTRLQEMPTVAWHQSEESLQDALRLWQSRPSYAPRPGELVLFASNLSVNESLS